MTDSELREMVRQSIVRHLGTAAPRPPVQGGEAHSSHVLLPVSRGADGEGVCLIEPAVRCNHCGYCQSYGH